MSDESEFVIDDGSGWGYSLGRYVSVPQAIIGQIADKSAEMAMERMEARVWLLEQRLTSRMGFVPEIIDNEVCCPFCRKRLLDVRKGGCADHDKRDICWLKAD